MKLLDKSKNLSLNQKLAALLFLLALGALVAGNPYTGAKTAIDAQELALIVDKQVDHVAAEELADWIIQNRADYRLIDLRTEKEFSAYHIPTAENLPLAALLQADLGRNEKVILYSEGGIHSAQAWFLLKAHGFQSAYMLFGGLEEWKDQILFPRLAEEASTEQAQAFAKIREVSKYFGGTPQTGSATLATQPQRSLPQPTLPQAGSGMKPQAKKKKEGC